MRPSARFTRRFLLVLLLAAVARADGLSRSDIHLVQTALGDMHDSIRDEYYPRNKVGREFDLACAAAKDGIAHAANFNEANVAISDALMTLDLRIRFFPPLRSARADYGWDWRLIGDAAYVIHVDREGDASVKGLKVGDRILTIQGAPLNRSTYEQIYHLYYKLAPQPGLLVQVQTGREPPRTLAIATTLRPPRRLRTTGLSPATVEWELTSSEYARQKAREDVKQHVVRIGRIAIWRMYDLENDIGDIAAGLKLVGDAATLVLDLRQIWGPREETALRLLDGLFASTFEIAKLQHDRFRSSLKVRGGSGAFKGTIFVLTDANTAKYAELVAAVIQRRKRGLVLGDRTAGQLFETTTVAYARGALFAFSFAGVRVPSGEITFSDGSSLDGHGLTPNLVLLPQPADLIAGRDPVLARAAAMSEETLSPENAYRLFHRERPDDEDPD